MWDQILVFYYGEARSFFLLLETKNDLIGTRRLYECRLDWTSVLRQ